MSIRRILPILTLLALPFLVGSTCAFFFSSGDGSSDKKDREIKEEDQMVIANSGNFGDPAVQGVSFESGAVSGVTGSQGEFQYEPGKKVQFSIGDIHLGEAVKGKSEISAQDLVDNATADTPAVINIERLLVSLDSEVADDIITIPRAVRTAAVRSNADLAPAIEALEFSDEAAFANAGSQLVAVLTDDYPFTATLVDADEAGRRMNKRP